MIPVQYRDPRTEEILERRYEEGAPAIGTRVRIGFDEYRSSTGGVACRPRASSTCTGLSGRSVGGQACGLSGPSVPSALGRGLLE